MLQFLVGSRSTSRCFRPTASYWLPCKCCPIAGSELRPQGRAVFPGSFHSHWKRTPFERLFLQSRWQFRGAVSRLLDTRSEAMTASQPKNKIDCQPRSPRGKNETAATFGRVMSSVVRQPGENIESLACFYSIFLSLTPSGEKVSSHLHHNSLPIISVSVLTSPFLPAEMCYSDWEANLHHPAHEYRMASSSFD